MFIIDQFQSQLGIETFIVAATYSIVSFSVVMLIYGVPKMQNQRTGVYALVTCFMIGLSVLYYLFRVKNSSYPFKLLL